MKENIILIGFMGSGKSTVGRELAKVLEMKFIDTDNYIEKMEKMSIKTIFNKKGKEYFRNIEKKYIEKISQMDHTVIATGGGVATSTANMKNLKKKGFVVYLNCTVDCLYERVSRRNTRPLLNGYPDLRSRVVELLEERLKSYEKSMDAEVYIDNNTNLWDTVDIIKNLYIQSN